MLVFVLHKAGQSKTFYEIEGTKELAYILFISRYYLPEKAAAAVCVSETAKRLVQRGHQVVVLTTFPNYPTGVVPQEYRCRIRQEEIIEGVRVLRVWSYISANKGFFLRIFAQFSFGCLAPLIGGKAIGKPDMIIVESPPLFNVIAAHILGWRKKCPFIFWVADLWPESAVQLGALRNKTLIRLSEWLEWSTYKRARNVWVVTEGMRDTLIRRGLPPERILLIRNGVDTEKFRSLLWEEARKQLQWDERYTVLYAGTHGLAHGLMTLLDAAQLLQEHADIRFVLVGDGAEKAALIAHAQQEQLNNVCFLNPLPHEQMPMLLAAADVCVAHTRKVQLFEGMLPMKMYEAMAAERPLIVALNGEACRMAVEEAKAALHVEPENATELATSILFLYEHPEFARQLGQNGRAYIEGRFDYNTLTATLDAHLQSVLKGK